MTDEVFMLYINDTYECTDITDGIVHLKSCDKYTTTVVLQEGDMENKLEVGKKYFVTIKDFVPIK